MADSEQRTILIADPDVESLKLLGVALKEDGYRILAAKDGSRALEQSILNKPHLVVFDQACPILGVAKFRQILRSNPRTEDIPLIIMGAGEIKEERVHGYLQGVIRKPFNVHEVRAYVAGIFQKMATAEEVQAEQGAITGKLSQMALVDLLQIFSLNRKTGQLKLIGPDGREALIWIHEGQMEAAESGKAGGTKALYRLLRWKEGDFAFVPGRRAAASNLSGGTDGHLMEGLRQSDELDRLLPSLPAPTAELASNVLPDAMPEGLHPVTAELLSALPYYRIVEELVDKVTATDLEAFQALQGLISKGLVTVAAQGAVRDERPLLTENELTDLRTRMRQFGLPPMYIDRPKVCLVASSPASLKQVLLTLRKQRLVEIGNHAVGGWGTIGTLALGGPVRLEYVALPPLVELAPLVRLMSLGSIGTLVFSGDVGEEARRQLKAALPGPLVNISGTARTVPGEFSLPLTEELGPEAAVRDALHTFLTRLACFAAEGPGDEAM